MGRRIDEDFILERVDIDRESGCWFWTGPKSNSGYATYKNNWIHRRSHELWNGPIPEKWQVDHSCAHKLCVNPQHLTAVPKYLNAKLIWRRKKGQMPYRDLKVARLLHRMVGEGRWPYEPPVHVRESMRRDSLNV